MKNILCYGDSNTWGFDPDMRLRFPRETRWPGVLRGLLGEGYNIIEEGLNGRTTVFEDPSSAGRNGLKWLCPCIQTHQPLDLIVIMLGTNDTKAMYSAPAKEIANGMEELVRVAKNPFTVGYGEPPEVLVISPVLVGDQIEGSSMWEVFDHGSVARSKGLAAEYERIANDYGCYFLNAAKVAKAASGECVHLNAEGHRALAAAIADKINDIIVRGRRHE